MNKNRKGFTIVELVIVIGVIGVLSAILIPTFSNMVNKAEVASDKSMLANINLVLSTENENIKTTKDAYKALKEHGIEKNSIVAKQNGYRFAYDKDSNIFIYEKDEFFTTEPVSYTGTNYKTTLFGASNAEHGLTGFKTHTGSTTYEYKYLVKNTNEVIEGETITENNTFTYWLHVPENYKSYIQYPLITYVHGSGGCLFLQENCDDVTVDIPSSSSFWDINTSYWMGMQNPEKSNRILRTSMRDDYTSIGAGSAFGGNWDSHFISAWFSWVQSHPEDDAFIIFAEINDEIWFDNLGTYTINDKQCEMLCIYNSYKAGLDYGEALEGGSSRYNTTYNSSVLGPNVWFQLLTQVQDGLMNDYNIANQFVIGASLGGIATYDLISNYPDRFSAAFPCAAPCADIRDENISKIVNHGTEVHAYHGGSDGAVSSKPSKSFCDAISDAGGTASFTSVSGVGHASTPLSTYFNDIINVIERLSR